jgi:hypothetical protein
MDVGMMPTSMQVVSWGTPDKILRCLDFGRNALFALAARPTRCRKVG